jgi:hypothetical protein
LIEVPFGKTLREIVLNIGGGVLKDDGSIDLKVSRLYRSVVHPVVVSLVTTSISALILILLKKWGP